MGDWADYYIDQMLDDHSIDPCHRDQPLTCSRCGEEGLHWADWRGKSRLANPDDTWHACDPAILAAKVFSGG